MIASDAITIRFALPSAELRPYITTYYYTCYEPATSGAELEDFLHPEWANLRFVEEGAASHAIGQDDPKPTPRFAATGPTSMATRFRMREGRSWGIGLLPLGWARFVDAPADCYADRAVDGMSDAAFKGFRQLGLALSSSDGSFAGELDLIERHMQSLLERPSIDEKPILLFNTAIVDSAVTTVAELAERTGMNIRTVERLSYRVFGFSPKLLLRRQRFLRSLAQFMLDPSLKWLSAMDYHYHDQAHFVRDFRRFMGMTPTAYGKLDHPFLRAAARARAEIAGEAVQALHDPKG